VVITVTQGHVPGLNVPHCLQVNQLETQLGLSSTGEGEANKTGSTQGKSSTTGDKGATRKAGSLLPAAPRQNPYEGTDFEAAPVQGYSLQATVKVRGGGAGIVNGPCVLCCNG
jgi:hypothetical protein